MTAALQADRVTYRYPQHGRGQHGRGQNSHGLEPVSITAGSGECHLVTGPSGCGKSTLARCLTGLIPHIYHGELAGTVRLGGLPTATTPLWQLAERAGLVFQNPASQMLAESVEEEIVFGLENLGLSRDSLRERLELTLARFGLESLRRRTPQTLSGGEQQKLALAAITARRPPVLVLDEPLSMLDSSAAMALVDHLIDLTSSDTAVVICEHREEYLRPVPNLATLRLGRPAWVQSESSGNGFKPQAVPAIEIEADGLAVKFGDRSILRGLSFTMRGGEVIAIVGCNGVGKTTLLRALTGLQAHEGSVVVNGQRPELGLVFQNPDLQLFNATVREEILFRVPDPDLGLYTWLLETLGLTHHEQVAPLLLSEGEKKRVALATVLMRQPGHGVLLDEPAVGQDTSHKRRLVKLARGLAEAGQIVILTTHDLPLAAQADRLLLLGAEGFVADGPPADILCDPAPWHSLGLVVPDWVRAEIGAYEGYLA